MDKQTLERLYAEHGSVSAVARHLNCSISTMRYWFKKHDIEISRGYKSPRKKKVAKGSEHYNWKGGTYIHSCGYIMEYAPEHPASKPAKGYVPQHRLVMERHIGRYLTEDEIVHHKDENKQNNDISNLEILDRSTHIALHKKTVKRDKRGRFMKTSEG
ncbi:HNH endonuclease [Fictibacillus sp. Mic-4]|uniref:HNH endonuclease n=1 Tax=Fictibacillus sp. Mic-4 TaxID=3132826 RepID=UPI003CED4EB8